MRLSQRATIPFPIDFVFERARDELHLLADLLPDVETIEPLTRRVDATATERVDRWRTRKLGVSRRAIPTTQLTWIATSRWDSRSHRVDWTVDVLEPSRVATSRGDLVLRASSADETELAMNLDITFDASTAAKATRLFSFAFRPLLNRTAERMLKRNITSLMRWNAPSRLAAV